MSGGNSGSTAMSLRGRSWHARRTLGPTSNRANTACSEALGGGKVSAPRSTRMRQVVKRARPPTNAGHTNSAAAWINDVDQATAAFDQPTRRPCHEYERQEHNINPVELDFEIPARPVHTWIAHMTIAQGHLQPIRVQLPLCEHLTRALPNPEQSEHRQQYGGGQQGRGKPMIAGSRT